MCCAGDRTNVAGSDLSDLLPEEVEAEVKLAAEISMGTEVSEQDIGNIRHLCDQVCVRVLSLGVELKWLLWWWRHLSLSWNNTCGFSVTTSSEQSHATPPTLHYWIDLYHWSDWLSAGSCNMDLSLFAGDRHFRLSHSAVRLPQEPNDCHRPQLDCDGGWTGRCPSHLTCW